MAERPIHHHLTHLHLEQSLNFTRLTFISVSATTLNTNQLLTRRASGSFSVANAFCCSLKSFPGQVEGPAARACRPSARRLSMLSDRERLTGAFYAVLLGGS